MAAQLPDPKAYGQLMPCGRKAGLRIEALIFRTRFRSAANAAVLSRQKTAAKHRRFSKV